MKVKGKKNNNNETTTTTTTTTTDADGDSGMVDMHRPALVADNGESQSLRLGGGVDPDTGDPEAIRRRILAETRHLDADSDEGGDSDAEGEGGEEEEDDDDDDDDESEDEDDEEVLLRELEKIKKERAEQREKEEHEKAAREQAKRELDITRGNPLLNSDAFSVKRRWDDDVIFKNQARGTDDRNAKKEFVNDLLRSDFHKKFMVRFGLCPCPCPCPLQYIIYIGLHFIYIQSRYVR